MLNSQYLNIQKNGVDNALCHLSFKMSYLVLNESPFEISFYNLHKNETSLVGHTSNTDQGKHRKNITEIYASEREQERKSVCVYMCVCERERNRECVCSRKRERWCEREIEQTRGETERDFLSLPSLTRPLWLANKYRKS